MYYYITFALVPEILFIILTIYSFIDKVRVNELFGYSYTSYHYDQFEQKYIFKYSYAQILLLSLNNGFIIAKLFSCKKKQQDSIV